ncbi:MAG: RagB/SusD family nutrient uptake outer membrane protein [Prevotella sp.]|nr:RagB/SusD family nutrient uptake outer membrane protein [Prevotella sp.]
MKKILYIICGFLAVTSCDDYLDVVPVNDITTIETQFEKREEADYWLMTCYSFATVNSAKATGNPAIFGADEFCAGEYLRKTIAEYFAPSIFIGDGLQMANAPYCDVWHKNQYFAALRYCNIFLENIDHVYNMQDKEKALWRDEVKALKAYYYFDMMRRYGPIILVDENIPANSSINEMMQSRRPIDECVDAIVKLCDETMQTIPLRKNTTIDRWAYLSKEGVATIKALTLLYAASPLFNGNTAFADFTNRDGERLFPEYDKEKWRKAAEAADEALRICEEGDLYLNQGAKDRPTKLLNLIEDIEHTWSGHRHENPEAIWMVVKADERPYGLEWLVKVYADPIFTDYVDRNENYGCVGAPMKMVEMFYTDHGVPINEDRQWMPLKYQLSKESDEKYQDVLPLNEEILSLHRRREPRFYAMIAADRTYWYRRTSAPALASVYEPILCLNRQGEAFGTMASRYDESRPQCLTGYWIKKYISPNVMFELYSERNAEYDPIVMMRLSDLYLASAEAWNEYLDAPNDHVYEMIDKVRERAGILKVRDAWHNYAKNSSKVDTKVGMREIIHDEWNVEFAFESRRFWNLRRWMTAPNELNQPQYGWNILASDQAGFYCNYEGPKVVWSKRSFTAPRDYFFPIRAEQILISGVKQNPGW